MRDRSLSKNGFDSHVRKNGAGQHNWGSIHDELELEYAALEDEEFEKAEGAVGRSESGSALQSGQSRSHLKKPVVELSLDDVIRTSVEVRKNAFKKQEIDLSTIARTSVAVSHFE